MSLLRNFKKTSFNEHLWVIFIWLLVFALPVIILRNQGYANWEQIFNIWKRILPFGALFLLNHYLLVPYFFLKSRKAMYFTIAAFFILIISGNEFLKPKPNKRQNPAIHSERIDQRRPMHPLRPPHDRAKINKERHPLHVPPGQLPPFLSVFLVSILIVGFDTGIKTTLKWSEKEKEVAMLENKNIQNQLAFLKNQVSPHFFMNTLNNIHALVDIDTDEAKDSIIKLSKLMRYLLYESETEKVPLVKEFEFIKSYVNLMKLRYSDKVSINLNFSDNLPDKFIPPMLFISLIENAFKYGISYKEPSFIQMDFLVTANKILFEVRNKKLKVSNNSAYSGIGLKNTRQRLELLYGNNYQMDIIDKSDEFIVNLTIPLT